MQNNSDKSGYSGTPLARKLGIKENSRIALIHEPDEFERQLEGLPKDVVLRRDLRAGDLDVIVLFCARLSTLHLRCTPAAAKLSQSGGLWIAWPKKASGVITDIDEAAVRAHGLATGLVDNKICAIDATWSGLRFVRRLKDRT